MFGKSKSEEEKKPADGQQNNEESAKKAAVEPELTAEQKLQNEVKEWTDKYLYLQAEYQNFRKRTVRDLADAKNYAVADTLLPFLTVADYLRMAGAAAEQSANLDSLKQGLSMIIAQFDKALDELGVKRMTTVGEKFNPAIHEAVSHEVSEEVPEGVIISEWNSGYMLGEKQLRVPRVIVSAGKTVPPPPPETVEAVLESGAESTENSPESETDAGTEV